jgi:hypothetical protein
VSIQTARFTEWQDAALVPPDADETVLIYCPRENEPVWLGHLDGDAWRNIEGHEVTVSHWAPMPEPPDA